MCEGGLGDGRMVTHLNSCSDWEAKDG
jgi:hypothetical protein